MPCSTSGPAHCTFASIATGYCRGYRQHHGGYARPAARVIGPRSSCSGQASPAWVLFRKGQLQRAVADSTCGPLPQVFLMHCIFSAASRTWPAKSMYISRTHGTQLHAGFRQNLSASPHGKAALAGMPLRVQQQRQVIPAFHLPTSASSASWQLSQLAAASHPYTTVSHPMPCTQAVAAVTAPAAAAAAAAMAMASPEAARALTGGMPAASGRSSTHCH